MENSQKVKQTYTYDELKRVTSVTYEDGQRLVYQYDASGNIVSVTTVSIDSLPTADTAQAPVSKFCSECGQKLKDGVRFCSSCGKPV